MVRQATHPFGAAATIYFLWYFGLVVKPLVIVVFGAAVLVA
jgi:hypothetical protein